MISDLEEISIPPGRLHLARRPTMLQKALVGKNQSMSRMPLSPKGSSAR